MNIKLDKKEKYVIIMINSFSKEWFAPLFDYVEEYFLSNGGKMAGKVNKNLVHEIASVIIESQGLRLIEVEVNTSGDKVTLALIIDKKNGVNIEDCERISKLVDPALDEVKEIAGTYDYFTVSSAGLDRPFKTTEDFLTHIGEKIELKLYSSVNKKKNITAVLTEANDEFIVLNNNINILRSNIQKANIAIEF